MSHYKTYDALRNPVRDVTLLANTLKNELGFDTVSCVTSEEHKLDSVVRFQLTYRS
jgi:hypothetical protein